MVEADHDYATGRHDRAGQSRQKRLPYSGIARVQDITRPLGHTIDHGSVPFRSVCKPPIRRKLQYLHDAVSNLTKLSDQLQVTINITEQLADLTHRLTVSLMIWMANPSDPRPTQ